MLRACFGLMLIFSVSAAYAQDIDQVEVRAKRVFCGTVAKLAGVSMILRKDGKDKEYVEQEFRPAIDKAKQNFGPIAANMIRTQIALAFEDDEADPDSYASDAFDVCKKLLKII